MSRSCSWSSPIWLLQPERDMRRTHRLLDGAEQVVGQVLQLHLTAQPITEGSERARRVVLPAIEAPVDERLEAAAQRLKECGDDERGEDDEEGRLLFAARMREAAHNSLAADDADDVDEGEDGGQ